jgi:legumain
MYSELVFYLEACESGSMFDGILSNNINIYAVTAANPFESSWGTYCPPDDVVNGVEINSCLGDLFSVNWMEDSDKANIQKETLDQQFNILVNTTDKSHVMRYGDQKFVKEPIGNFIGNLNLDAPEESSFFETIFEKAKEMTGFETSPYAVDARKSRSAVNSRDIKLNHLHAKVQRKNSEKAQKELQSEINKRIRADHAFELFAAATGIEAENNQVLPRSFECIKTVMSAHDNSCGKFDDYSLQYVKYIVHACEASAHTVEELVDHMVSSCPIGHEQ